MNPLTIPSPRHHEQRKVKHHITVQIHTGARLKTNHRKSGYTDTKALDYSHHGAENAVERECSRIKEVAILTYGEEY